MRWFPLLFGLVVLPLSPALAHGQFPLPLGTLLDGARANPVLVNTFGLLIPVPGQTAFSWVCEEVPGGSMSNAVVWTRTAAGTVLAGSRDGLWRFSSGLCNATQVEGIDLSARIRTLVSHTSLPVVLVGLADATVRISRDDGRTFAPLLEQAGGSAAGFLVEGTDSALEVTVLWRFIGDGTASFQRWSDAGGAGALVPINAPLATVWEVVARDPVRANQVYIRENADGPDRLLRADLTTGEVTQELLTATADELVLGISPSGRHVLMGGLTTDMQWSEDSGATFSPRATLNQLRSVTFVDEDTIYAAANNWQDRFALGVSDDGAQTWRGLGTFGDIRQVHACEDEGGARNVTAACAPYWPALKELFGIGVDAGVTQPPPDDPAPGPTPGGCPNGSLGMVLLVLPLRRVLRRHR